MQMIYDPRHYTLAYPESNMIINQALQVLNNKQPSGDLVESISNMLRKEQDTLLNVAINLAPSLETTQIIWDAMNTAINSPNCDTYANIFAIPIILVAGSKNKIKLNSQLKVDELNTFMQEKEIFKAGADAFISGKLIDPQSVANLKPSQLYYWARNLQKARLWLPVEVNTHAVEVHNEGVFLRFLIGVSIDNKGSSRVDMQAFSTNSMELMRMIHAELKTDGLTLFPIPFPPVSLSRAFTTGNLHRTEVAIQVAISNIVRKIREERQTPIAIITTEGEAIKIMINSEESGEWAETSLWSLTHLDDFDKVMQIITDLLNDTGVKWSYAATAAN